MLQLRDLQSAFARYLADGEAAPLVPAVASDGVSAAHRMQIYRNHLRISLSEALAATYPVVRRLLGDTCFGAFAKRYAVERPPSAPCLFEYGAGLAEFLEQFPELADFPYLPDVARLEWALNRAAHADETPALDPCRLAALDTAAFDRAVLLLHPSVTLLASPYPVAHIWKANQPGTDATEVVDLAEGGDRLLVLRRTADLDAGWRRLSAAEYTFLDRSAAGEPLMDAVAKAIAAGPFDIAFTLTEMLAEGAFGGIDQ